ncbi:FMRFamide receptor [Eurytemora carolleeae]|uniref:FMRFamide receptor n=1 Tax=Eurytemora carolleeae TaxID=1294199 RepID=UPI000C767518|nr:FMRFamide receptor [Eurytemora carolleeae]|eukprot:XP_023341605.1 FMRFamide receptor-like [Eurytemora affinis]
MMFLSFFDLLYLIASLLLFSVPLIWNAAPSHPAFTKSIPFILPTAHIGMTGSIYLTISLAVERYITVCHPFFKLSHNWPAWVYVLPIVVFSSVFNLPKFFELETVERPSYNSTNETLHENNSLPLYMVQPTDLRLNELYISGYIVWANFIINCVFPFLVLIFLNLAVYNELKKIQVEEVGTSRAGQILRQKERKLAQVSFIIVFVFILCHSVRWVPNIWEMCEKDGLEWPVWIEYTTYISHLLTTFNGTVNVLIYFIKHGNFTCR